MITPILPPAIRDAAPAVQREYRTALGFEHMLLSQLTKALAATTGEDEGASAATKTYRDMLPATMADALVDAGGIGLASDLVRTLKAGGP